jgi:hypothetical protein
MKLQRILKFGLFILMLGCFICGCGGNSSAEKPQAQKTAGSLVFNMDLSDIAAKTTTKVAAATTTTPTTITSATVTLSRSGFDPINFDLTVANNIATGRVDNLAEGYWHVIVHVYSDMTEIYTGESDANVLAGVDVQVKIYFDPTPVVKTTGSLSFSVGLNPMPGYKTVNQQVSKTLFSETTGKIYILDASANIIGVYDAESMIREKDIPLPSPPLAMSLNYAKNTLLLGYPSGQIYKLDPVTNAMTLFADVLTEVKCMAAISDKVLLVVGKGGYDSTFKTLDMANGQLLNTKSYWYSFNDIVFNTVNGVAYALSANVSPSDIHRIQIEPETGVFTEIKDSPYHGDYNIGLPLRIIKNGTRVATAGGTTFSSSSLSSQDMLYNGSMNYDYTDMAVDDALGNLYLLSPGNSYYSSTTAKKLLVINQSNFFLDKTVELLGDPKIIYQTASKIIVFTVKDSGYFVKVFAKGDLGF